VTYVIVNNVRIGGNKDDDDDDDNNSNNNSNNNNNNNPNAYNVRRDSRDTFTTVCTHT